MLDLFVFNLNTVYFQVFVFRNLEYVLCYSVVGHFKKENIAFCSGNSMRYQAIAYMVSLLPYWWRLLQVGTSLKNIQNFKFLGPGK